MADIIPHWHEDNPWNDHLIYVSLDELAECAIMQGKLVTLGNGDKKFWTKKDTLDHWLHYGHQLDAYILTGVTLTAGVRFGSAPDEYLSPGFSLPKLAELLKRARHRTRRSA